MDDYILQLVIQAKDEFSATLKSVENQLNDIQKTTQNTSKTATSTLS